MNWRNALQRTSLILGFISLALAVWGGMHLEHLLNDQGNRHFGETVVALAAALLVFAAGWYGARLKISHM